MSALDTSPSEGGIGSGLLNADTLLPGSDSVSALGRSFLVLVANTSAPLVLLWLSLVALALLGVLGASAVLVYVTRRVLRPRRAAGESKTEQVAEASADSRIEGYAARTTSGLGTAVSTVPGLLWNAARSVVQRLVQGWTFIVLVVIMCVWTVTFMYFQEPIVIVADTAYEYAGRLIRDYFAMFFANLVVLAYDGWVGFNNALLQWIMLIGGETALAAVRCASQNAVALGVGLVRAWAELAGAFVGWATSADAFSRVPDWSEGFEIFANTFNLLDQFGFCMCLDVGYLWSAFVYLPPEPFGRLINATLNGPLLTALILPAQAFILQGRPNFSLISANMYEWADASRDFTEEYVAAFDTDIRMFSAYLCFRAGGTQVECMANDPAFDLGGDTGLAGAALEAEGCVEDLEGEPIGGALAGGAACAFAALESTRPHATGLSFWPGPPWGPKLDTAFVAPIVFRRGRRWVGDNETATYGVPLPPEAVVEEEDPDGAASGGGNATSGRRRRAVRRVPASALLVRCSDTESVLFDPFNVVEGPVYPGGVYACRAECDGVCNPCELDTVAPNVGKPVCFTCPPGGYVPCVTATSVVDPYVYPPGSGDAALAVIDITGTLLPTACLPAIVCDDYGSFPSPLEAFLGNATFLRTSPSGAWSCAPWRATRTGISVFNFTLNALLAWDSLTPEHLRGEAITEELYGLCDCVETWGNGVLPLYALRNITRTASLACNAYVALYSNVWLMGVETIVWLGEVTNDYAFDEFKIFDPEYGVVEHPENKIAGAFRFLLTQWWDAGHVETLFAKVDAFAESIDTLFGSFYLSPHGKWYSGYLRFVFAIYKLFFNLLANMIRLPFFWIQTGIDFNPFFDALHTMVKAPGATLRILGGSCTTGTSEPDTALGEVVRFLWTETIGLPSELLPGDLPPCCLGDLADGVFGSAVNFVRVLFQFLVQVVPATIWNTAVPYISILPAINGTDYSLEVARPNYAALVADADIVADALGCLYSWTDFFVVTSSPVETGNEFCTIYEDSEDTVGVDYRLRQVVARTAAAIFRYGGRVVYSMTIFPENMMEGVLANPEEPELNPGAVEQLVDEWAHYVAGIVRAYGHLYNCFYTSTDVRADFIDDIFDEIPLAFPDAPVSDCYGNTAWDLLVNPGCVLVFVADALDELADVDATGTGSQFLTNALLVAVRLYSLAASIGDEAEYALRLAGVLDTANAIIQSMLDFFKGVINYILTDFWEGMVDFINVDLRGPINTALSGLTGLINTVIGFLNTRIQEAANVFRSVLEDFCQDLDSMAQGMCNAIYPLGSPSSCNNLITDAMCNAIGNGETGIGNINPISAPQLAEIPDIDWVELGVLDRRRGRAAEQRRDTPSGNASLGVMSLGASEDALVIFMGASTDTTRFLLRFATLTLSLHNDSASVCSGSLRHYINATTAMTHALRVQYPGTWIANTSLSLAALKVFSYDYSAAQRATLVRCASVDALTVAVWYWDPNLRVDMPIDALTSEGKAVELAASLVHGFAHLLFARVLPIGTLWSMNATSNATAYYVAARDYLVSMGVAHPSFVATMWVRGTEVLSYLIHPFISIPGITTENGGARRRTTPATPTAPVLKTAGQTERQTDKARADAFIDRMRRGGGGGGEQGGTRRSRRTRTPWLYAHATRKPDPARRRVGPQPAWSLGASAVRAAEGWLPAWQRAPSLGDLRRATLRRAVLDGRVHEHGACTPLNTTGAHEPTELQRRHGGEDMGSRRRADGRPERACAMPPHVRCEAPYCTLHGEIDVPREVGTPPVTVADRRRAAARAAATRIMERTRERAYDVRGRVARDDGGGGAPRPERPPAALPLERQPHGGPLPERALQVAAVTSARRRARGATVDALVEHIRALPGGTLGAFARGAAAARPAEHSSGPQVAELEAAVRLGGRRRAGSRRDDPPPTIPAWLNADILPSPVRAQVRDCPEVADWPIHCSVLSENACATVALVRNVITHYLFRVLTALADFLTIFNPEAAEAVRPAPEYVPDYPLISQENWGAVIPEALFPSDKLITTAEGLAEASRDTPVLSAMLDVIDWALKVDIRQSIVDTVRFIVDTNTTSHPPSTALGYLQDLATCRYQWDVEATRYATLGAGMFTWFLAILGGFYIGNYVPGVTSLVVTVVMAWPLGVMYVVYGWAPSCVLTPMLSMKPIIVLLVTIALGALGSLPSLIPTAISGYVPDIFIPSVGKLMPFVGALANLPLWALPPALFDDLHKLAFTIIFGVHLPWPEGLIVARADFPIPMPVSALGVFTPSPATDVFPCRAGMFPDSSYNLAWLVRFLAPGVYDTWSGTSASVLGVPLAGFPLNLLVDMSARFAAFPGADAVGAGSALEVWCWVGTLGNLLLDLLVIGLLAAVGILAALAVAALLYTAAVAWTSAVSGLVSTLAIRLVDRGAAREATRLEKMQ